jgi:hypothetical protein
MSGGARAIKSVSMSELFLEEVVASGSDAGGDTVKELRGEGGCEVCMRVNRGGGVWVKSIECLEWRAPYGGMKSSVVCKLTCNKVLIPCFE